MRPESGFRASDDGLADEDEAVVADVLNGVTNEVVVRGQQTSARRR